MLEKVARFDITSVFSDGGNDLNGQRLCFAAGSISFNHPTVIALYGMVAPTLHTAS